VPSLAPLYFLSCRRLEGLFPHKEACGGERTSAGAAGSPPGVRRRKAGTDRKHHDRKIVAERIPEGFRFGAPWKGCRGRRGSERPHASVHSSSARRPGGAEAEGHAAPLPSLPYSPSSSASWPLLFDAMPYRLHFSQRPFRDKPSSFEASVRLPPTRSSTVTI